MLVIERQPFPDVYKDKRGIDDEEYFKVRVIHGATVAITGKTLPVFLPEHAKSPG
jgi:hypothetical protein